MLSETIILFHSIHINLFSLAAGHGVM